MNAGADGRESACAAGGSGGASSIVNSGMARRGGAGIGLAIVKQLVEAAGGRVGAESQAGITRFWFSLPA